MTLAIRRPIGPNIEATPEIRPVTEINLFAAELHAAPPSTISICSKLKFSFCLNLKVNAPNFITAQLWAKAHDRSGDQP